MIEITKEYLATFIKSHKLELVPSQKKLCLPIVNRLYKKMKIGLAFSSIKVHDGVIIDGHHRYLASQLATYALSIAPASRPSILDLTDWQSIEYTCEEWDTAAKISMLNEEDAKYNGLPIDTILESLK